MKNEMIVQFSGGIDSLYAAHYLASRYDRVHLLTFDKGYLHLFLKANLSNVGLLKKLHGEDKIVHSLLDIRPLFKELGVKNYAETRDAFGNEIAWCVPCRASMALGSILYALEHEIPAFTDGANWEQAPDGEKVLVTADNYPEFLEVIKAFAAAYKISYLPLIYELNTRQERRDELLALGAKIDFNSLDRPRKSVFDVFRKAFFKRAQPMCLSGYLIHWKRNMFNVKEQLTPEMTVRGIQPKLDSTGKRLVEDYFAAKDLSVADLVRARG